MSEVRVIIIEDELHNSRLLEGMLESLRPEWQMEVILDSVEDSVTWLQNNPAPDLILMDIQLADGICFSILNQVKLPSDTHIVFTTAYDQYAIRAFKVNSVDYLLKPIKEHELEQAFAKFELRVKRDSPINQDYTKNKEYYQQMMHSILEGKRQYRSRFLIAGARDYTKLETKDIAYFYSSNKITFAVEFSGSEHIIDYTLGQLEGELNPQYFNRANRQIILNIDAVIKVSNASGNKLIVLTKPKLEFEVVVSRLKAADFKRWLGK